MKFRLRPIRNFFQGAVLLLALVVVALLSAIATMHFAIHGAEVQVPALKEMTVAEARSQTSGLGLNLEVDNRYYSSDVAAGHILSQSPLAGAVVRREWRVRVAESLGPQKVEVPSVVGAPERSAALNLRRVGLEAGMTAQLPWSKAEAGTVLAQDPPPKAQGIERPSVSLLVATADDTRADGYVMPDLTGLPIVTAENALTRVGIKFAEPVYKDVAIPAVAASGYAPVPVPGSVPAAPGAGSISSAASQPAGNAAASSAATGAPAPMKATAVPGAVIGQSPPAGWRVDVGSTVTLSVAK